MHGELLCCGGTLRQAVLQKTDNQHTHLEGNEGEEHKTKYAEVYPPALCKTWPNAFLFARMSLRGFQALTLGSQVPKTPRPLAPKPGPNAPSPKLPSQEPMGLDATCPTSFLKGQMRPDPH